jgi:hypothetical protein
MKISNNSGDVNPEDDAKLLKGNSYHILCITGITVNS